ncbi:ring finger domain-containing protein [Stagonosporopsis vannaccii]|nr:ring finger domain-containing protein [Stagonosporopsis vannaccii]
MTARGIGIFTIEFPDPTKINYVNNQFNTLNESVSFQYRGVTNIQTLSTKGASSGSDPYGILYVPDVFTESCRRNESQHVPANATRIANLPSDRNYALIAFAPWYSPQCMVEYFTAARQHSATKGFLTYLPGNNNAQPPVLNNPAWDLQDGGMWQQDNTFPTYALSSTSGNTVMDQLNLYSGNLSTVPNGDELGRIFDSTSYVRLWATVSTDSGGTLPSLWVFLVIVLAILIAAIGITSLCMHIIQRRRRNALRQRVLNGEIDLEALGVKRLTVSQQLLNKMPIVTYTAGPDVEKPPEPLPALDLAPGGGDADPGSKPPLARRLSAPTASHPSSAAFSQPTCPICIDDFEPNETQVRELPCRHIFHPDCIDTFLLRSSSLCPMCKQSVLPAGVCPVKITNMMVRRERHISRMRARSDWSAAHGGAVQPVSVTVSEHARGAFGSIGRAVAGRRIFSAPERPTAQAQGDIEMGTANPAPPPPPPPTVPPQPVSSLPSLPAQTHTSPSQTPHDCDAPPPPSLNRREWARQRALHLLGTRHAPPESDVDVLEQEERARPKWKRVVTRVFPGFR